MGLKPRPQPTLEEVLGYIEKEHDCWLWTRQKNADGYGLFRFGGRANARRAHRVIYEMIVGPIPEGLVLDHLCEVRHCVNPDHLEPVTTQENVRRAFRKQTHCVHGHEYNDENTYVYYGRRTCGECARQRSRAAYRKKRAARENT